MCGTQDSHNISPVPSVCGPPSQAAFSSSMVRLRVGFGLPLLLYLSGVHVNAVYAGSALVILKICPSQFHLLLFRTMQWFHVLFFDGVWYIVDGLRSTHMQCLP